MYLTECTNFECRLSYNRSNNDVRCTQANPSMSDELSSVSYSFVFCSSLC